MRGRDQIAAVRVDADLQSLLVNCTLVIGAEVEIEPLLLPSAIAIAVESGDVQASDRQVAGTRRLELEVALHVGVELGLGLLVHAAAGDALEGLELGLHLGLLDADGSAKRLDLRLDLRANAALGVFHQLAEVGDILVERLLQAADIIAELLDFDHHLRDRRVAGTVEPGSIEHAESRERNARGHSGKGSTHHVLESS